MSTLERNIPLPDTVGATHSQSHTRTITSSRGNTLAIYLRHLLQRTSRSTVIWTISVAAYGAMIVAVFPSMKNAVDVSSYPEGLQKALSITSMNEIAPFLSAELFGYLPLVLAFVPLTMFAAAIAGAEERGSLDVVLGTPLPRRNLVITNFVTAAIDLFMISAFLGIALWITSDGVDAGLPLTSAMAGSLAAVPGALALGSVALLFSSVSRQRSKALGLGVGVLFVMYMLDLVAKLVDSLSWMRYFSAFYYYGNAVVDGVFWGGVFVLLVTALLLAGAAIILFERRDVFA